MLKQNRKITQSIRIINYQFSLKSCQLKLTNFKMRNLKLTLINYKIISQLFYKLNRSQLLRNPTINHRLKVESKGGQNLQLNATFLKSLPDFCCNRNLGHTYQNLPSRMKSSFNALLETENSH